MTRYELAAAFARGWPIRDEKTPPLGSPLPGPLPWLAEEPPLVPSFTPTRLRETDCYLCTRRHVTTTREGEPAICARCGAESLFLDGLA